MSVDEVEPIEEEAADENAVAPQGTHLASTQTITHEYLTQSGKVMRETVTTNQTVTAVMDFVYDESGKPFAMIDQLSAQPKTYYYVLNLQGDVVKLVTDSGAVAASYEYDAWGNILASSGSMAEKNPLRYRGYYYDSETGFYYLQSRYYDPATRRFINADVYASTDSRDAISCNVFSYCKNNPVLLEDQNGELGIIGISLLFGLGCALLDYGEQVISNYEDGYTGKEAWVDNVSFGRVVSSGFSGSLAFSAYGVGSAIADFIISPAIELSVDYAISPEKKQPLNLENYMIKQGERFGELCITEEIKDAIPRSFQNPLTGNAVRSTVKEMARSNMASTIYSTIKDFALAIIK